MYKLSNSGKALKLIIPSVYGNIYYGWSNYSEKVKSYKIDENLMGNRGSKHNKVLTLLLKEQRVDGSWYILLKNKHIYLRYTLIIC